MIPIWGMTDGECDCGKRSCTPGKHPVGVGDFAPHGVKDASTDDETINRWFEKYPTVNLALATGHPLAKGGYLVGVDVDPGRGGNESLAALEAGKPPALPRTIANRTGGGGLHILLSSPTSLRQSTDRLGKGLEVKSAGGYLIAPPSLHRSGRRYSWPDGFDPGVLTLIGPPEAPQWFVDLATDGDSFSGAPAQEEPNGRPELVELVGRALQKAPSKGRNDAMFVDFLCLARDVGYTEGELLAQSTRITEAVTLLMPTNGNGEPQPTPRQNCEPRSSRRSLARRGWSSHEMSLGLLSRHARRLAFRSMPCRQRSLHSSWLSRIRLRSRRISPRCSVSESCPALPWAARSSTAAHGRKNSACT